MSGQTWEGPGLAHPDRSPCNCYQCGEAMPMPGSSMARRFVLVPLRPLVVPWRPESVLGKPFEWRLYDRAKAVPEKLLGRTELADVDAAKAWAERLIGGHR